jgi:hypothetical protein
MTYAGGEKIRASVLNKLMPISDYQDTTTTRTSTTTLADSSLAVDLEADALYAFEGYLAYDAGATGDLKVALAAPTGATGHWGLNAIHTGSTGSVGDLDARRSAGFGDANTQTAGGSDAFGSSLVAPIYGYIDTSSTAGELRVRVAQNTSSGTSTVLVFGSWLTAWRLD